ncbi:TonB-dependent receptor [Winogradskyella sp. A3E31]|uniref:TonB-dependent receptor n=1 Tax=Winogradskyella sp. A3E31 TaxID=3349637 RepID=UPI00398A7FDB
MKLFTLWLSILLACPIFAQTTITGKVVDSETSSPLFYVTIYSPQLEKGTTTDDTGSFSIELPNGNNKLVISSLGYATQSITVNENTSGLIVQLVPSAIEMEEIIVSTPFHKLQSENVMKVEQVSINELKANGQLTLADGITTIAGVESISTGNSIGKPVIRGLSSNRVLVYTQGVRLENQQFGDEHGLGINDAGVESVEVIKGPASLLYGSDALGGVLYINPERFANTHESSADASGTYFSNTKGYSTNAGYKQSGEKLKYLFRGSLAEHSDYNTEDYRVTNSRFREQDFKAGIGFQDVNFKTELRYNINASELGIPEEIGEQSTNRSVLLPYQDIENHIFSLKSSVFFKNSSLDVTAGYIYNNRREFEDHHHEGEEEHEEEEHEDEEHEEEEEVEEAALHMKLKTFNYDIKYNFPQFGKFETIVGVQGMNQVNTNYGEEQLIPDATTNDIGILATSHIHFNTLDIQLGVRFDNRNIDIIELGSRSFNSFNGAFGVKTNIVDKLSVRLNLASGFRAPNLAELGSDGEHEGTNRYEIGNFNLDNEQNFQADLALEFKNEHVEIFANGFYNKVNNYIFLNPNGDFIDGDPVFLYDQDNAKLYGGEFGMHLHPHPIDWLHLESSFETVTGKQDNSEFLPLIPANSLTNTLRVEFNDDQLKNSYAFVTLKSTFQQNNVSAFETETDSYNLLSAGLGATLNVLDNDLTVRITGKNLLNTTYIHHLSRLKPNDIFNPGRNIIVGMTYTL